MDWTRYSNPLDTETLKFDRAVKSAQKLLRQLRAGEDDHTHALLKKVIRAVDRVQDLDRFVDEERREVGRDLRRQIGAAEDEGTKARQEGRERELRGLRDRQIEAEERKSPELRQYEKELRLMRGRR